MDLRHLKLLEEDDASWRVHDARDGKAFRVAKNGLGEGTRAAIVQHFAEGGEVKADDEAKSKGFSFGALPASEPSELYKPEEWRRKTDEEAAARIAAQRLEADVEARADSDAAFRVATKPSNYKPGTAPPADMLSPLDLMARTQALMAPPVAPGAATTPAATPGAPAAPVDLGLVPQLPPSSPASLPMASAAVPPSAGVGGSGVGGFMRDIGQAEKGLIGAEQKRAELAGQVAQDTLTLQRAAQVERQAIAEQWKQKYADNQARADALRQEMASGKLDPTHWWKNQNLGGKVAASIALVLGGLGQAFGGGPNQALSVINGAIDKDIDAQKTDLGKKQNLLSHYIQQGHDIQAATQLAKADQMDAYAGQMQMVASKYGGQEAAVNADKTIAGIKGDAAKMRQGAMQQGFENNLKTAELRLKAAALAAKEAPVSNLVAPGFVKGQVPIKDEEAAKFRGALAAQRDIESAAAELKALVQKHGTEGFPGEVKAKMGALHSKLILKKKNLEQLGAISGTDMSLIEGEVPDPRGWTPEAIANNITKLDQLVANGRGTIESASNAMGLQRVQQQAPQGLVVR